MVAARTVIVIMGNRSGTSALAGTLAHLGAALPRNLMPAGPDNQKGYYELQDIMEIHEALLAEIGSSWRDWRRIPDTWFASAAAESYAARLEAAFCEDYGEAPLVVLKEPRIGLLWPLWSDVFQRLSVTPLIVFSLRHPLDVTRSLAARDLSSPLRGLMHWLRLHLEAEKATRFVPRAFVFYDDLLADWHGAIAHLDAALGTTLSQRIPEAGGAVYAFLDPGLRHQGGAAPAADAHPKILVWAERTFRVLTCLTSSGTAPAPLWRELDSIRARFDHLTAAIAPLHEADGMALARAVRIARLPILAWLIAAWLGRGAEAGATSGRSRVPLRRPPRRRRWPPLRRRRRNPRQRSRWRNCRPH